MSAPDTNVEKQSRRHKGPIIGIALAVAFGGLMALLMTGTSIFRGEEPEGANVQIDGRTGAEEPVESAPAATGN